MRNARKSTCKVIELAEQGVLSWEDIARECLSYMSEALVDDMARSCDWIAEEEDEEEDEASDSWADSSEYDDDIQFGGESPVKAEE